GRPETLGAQTFPQRKQAQFFDSAISIIINKFPLLVASSSSYTIFMNNGKITLFRNRTGWNARFSGPCCDEIRHMFGADTMPLPWTADAQPAVVLLDMEGRWPGV